MKQYKVPELTISSFDVEDIITASGVVGNISDKIAEFAFTSENGGAAQIETATGAYFSWDLS